MPKSESFKKGIAVSSVMNLCAKGLTFTTNLGVAAIFGTRIETDIYYFALMTVVVLISFPSQISNSVVIPESMRIRSQESNASALTFLNFFLGLYLFVGLVVTAAVMAFPVESFTLGSQFDREALNEHSYLLMMAAPLILLMSVNGFCYRILTSYKHFTVPAIIQALSNSSVIVFLLLFHKSLGITSLMAGMLVGQSCQTGLLLYLMNKRLGWRPAWTPLRLGRKRWLDIVYVVIGRFATSVSLFIPSYLLSGMAQGDVAALNFGHRVALLPMSILIVPFSGVASIRFNELFPQKRFEDMDLVYQKTMEVLLFLLIPFSAVLFAFSEEIITLLFKRGAFDDASVDATRTMAAILGLTLPFLAINSLTQTTLMAAQLIKNIFWYQCLSNAVLTLFICVGVFLFGAVGYPIGDLSLQTVNMLGLFWLIKLSVPFISYKKTMGRLAAILIMNAALIGLVLALLSALGVVHPLIRLFAGSSIFVVLLIGINVVFKLNNHVNQLLFDGIARVFPNMKSES